MGSGGSWNPVDVVQKAIDTTKNFVKDPLEYVKKKGRDVNDIAINFGDTIEKGLHDTGDAIEKGLHDTGDALDPSNWSLGLDGDETNGTGGLSENEILPELGTTREGYSLSVEAAKRRKKLLTQQKGFLSTIKSSNSKNTEATNLLTTNLGGKTKLGQ